MRDLNLITVGWFFFTTWSATIAVLILKAFGPELVHELAGIRRIRTSNLK